MSPKQGHEYENFILDQAKSKHQIVQMTDPSRVLCKGNQATIATAQQWAAKFQSCILVHLGFSGKTKLPLRELEHEASWQPFVNIYTTSNLTHTLIILLNIILSLLSEHVATI